MSTSTRRQFLQRTATGVAEMRPFGLARTVASGTAAVGVNEFLSPLGACSAISRRGENLASTIDAAMCLGLRWLRVGYESDIPLPDRIELHNRTGVRFRYGLMSGGTDIARLLAGPESWPLPATVHDLLLQKSEGTFDLVVWGERFTGGSDNVTVNLGATHPTVEIYDPTVGAASTQTLTDIRSIGLTLSDHLVIVEVG